MPKQGSEPSANFVICYRVSGKVESSHLSCSFLSLPEASMPSDESVTGWLMRFQEGDRAAAQQPWQRYFHRLVGLARGRLQGRQRRVADEEDVALSAFNSFFAGLEQGRFPSVHDRDDLWRVLVTLTTRKAQHQVRDQARQKRGGGAV